MMSDKPAVQMRSGKPGMGGWPSRQSFGGNFDITVRVLAYRSRSGDVHCDRRILGRELIREPPCDLGNHRPVLLGKRPEVLVIHGKRRGGFRMKSLLPLVSEGRPAESATRTGGSGLGQGGRQLTSDGQAQTCSNPGIP